MRIQTELKARNAVSAVPIELRIGVRLGDVIYREGDVFGDGVNIAARVQGSASAGEIRFSEDVARQVTNKIAPRRSDHGKARKRFGTRTPTAGCDYRAGTGARRKAKGQGWAR